MLFVVSDTLTQQLVEKRRWNHDARRMLRMGVMGIIVGPIQRTWFLTLERFIPPTSKIQIVKKLIVDQTIYGPFIIFFFYSLSGILAGKELREVKLLLQERYIKTMLTAYKIWPLVQAVNFSVVPLQHRANFVQLVSLCWNMYLSWMANKSIGSDVELQTHAELVPSQQAKNI